jgi:hypothetical protein
MGSSQHFVPQFYFRLFTAGERRIHVLLKTLERVVMNVSVREQCARHRFYGSEEIESVLSKLEGDHSHALRRILACAWSSTPVPLTPEDFQVVREAVVFQRARTQLELTKVTPERECFMLEIFKQHLLYQADEMSARIVKEIERGTVKVKVQQQAMVIQSIDIALESSALISDLSAHMLRNHTDYPFLFGDAPVVFCNTLCQRVVSRGVLGLQTPGLQIFYPLNSESMLLLIDDENYRGRFKGSPFIDVTERSDVSQLNALQLHHSLNTVYFAAAETADYVLDLWNAHKGHIIRPAISAGWKHGWLVDGKPVDDLYHLFEPQLNIRLQLSFIECNPILDADFSFDIASLSWLSSTKPICRKPRSAKPLRVKVSLMAPTLPKADHKFNRLSERRSNFGRHSRVSCLGWLARRQNNYVAILIAAQRTQKSSTGVLSLRLHISDGLGSCRGHRRLRSRSTERQSTVEFGLKCCGHGEILATSPP